MKYYIKITGEGTKEEILDALEGVAHSLREATDDELDGAEWKDKTLMTEVNHD